MAGNRRIVVGDIAQGNLRGKALGDALYRDLNKLPAEDGVPNKKKRYGTK